MEWNKKTELVKLCNQLDSTKESRKAFFEYVLSVVDEFDYQAWDMFFEGVNIIPQEMTENVEYWDILIPKIEAIDLKDAHFGARTAIRCEFIKLTYTDDVKQL